MQHWFLTSSSEDDFEDVVRTDIINTLPSYIKQPPDNGLEELKALMEYGDSEFAEIEKYASETFLNAEKFQQFNGRVTESTIHQLILYLISDESNTSFSTVFFSTLLKYVNPDFVLMSLFYLYYQKDKSYHLKILLTILRWYSFYSFQFNSKMVSALSKFADQINSKKLKQSLKTNATINAGKSLEQFPRMELPTEPPSSWTITMIPPNELSRQIQYYDSNLFMKISPKDIIDDTESEVIKQMIDFSDKLENYVILSILMGVKPKERKAQYIYWLHVARYLLEYNDFNGLFAVYSGLNDPSISRLKKTLKLLKNHLMEISELNDFCASDFDFNCYKNRISALQEGSYIPCANILHNDLIKFDYEVFNKTNKEMINMSIMYKLSPILNILCTSRRIEQKFRFHERIQELLEQLPPITDQTVIMKISFDKEKATGPNPLKNNENESMFNSLNLPPSPRKTPKVRRVTSI
ncbi:hypothetical protein TRFO_04352 [Tritrichomonas foetus]|uniref:RasGEF domain containing protein n=1 Tax=Tritrichomonas foetus TaxID=1144522 RepID=A0A1J4KKE6_9EUKA|nr:hypothetical protein TRFO_04352 [Tritrichomonas foetus]|eukprot:OHT10308.1 hypothetical protein TRFO_04352 [Tritrichomonas foetus]